MTISRLALVLAAGAGLSACAVDVDPPEVAACKAAVAAQSGGGALSVVSNEPIIDGKRVMLRDAGGTTWDCLTDMAGGVTDLDYAL